MEQITDTELAAQAKAGDVPAFEALYRRYNTRVFNFARQLSLSNEDAADVVQEAFIRAWNSLPSLRDETVFGTWLHRIVLNAGRDLLKKRGRAHQWSIEELAQRDSAAIEIPGGAPSPERVLLSSETDEAVRRAIASLAEDHRLVVTMHHLEGMGVESIARILGISRGTVMSRLSRAREILRRKLIPYVEEGYDAGSQ